MDVWHQVCINKHLMKSFNTQSMNNEVRVKRGHKSVLNDRNELDTSNLLQSLPLCSNEGSVFVNTLQCVQFMPQQYNL